MKKKMIGLFLLCSLIGFSFNSVDSIREKSRQIPKENAFKYHGERNNEFWYNWNSIDAKVTYKNNEVKEIYIKGTYISEQNKGKVFEKFLRELNKIVGIENFNTVLQKLNLNEDYLYFATDEKQVFTEETKQYKLTVSSRRDLGEFFFGASWTSRRTKDKNALIISIKAK